VARLSPELRAEARRHAERSFDWRNTFEALARLYRELAPAMAAQA
jgi:glycosyltransferase involved in cell wall biosynthesis